MRYSRAVMTFSLLGLAVLVGGAFVAGRHSVRLERMRAVREGEELADNEKPAPPPFQDRIVWGARHEKREDFRDVAVSGGHIAMAANTQLTLAKADSGKTRYVLSAPENGIGLVAFSPDGKFVVSGNEGDCGDDGLYFWSVATGEKLWYRLGHHGPAWGVTALTFSPDGGRVVTGGGDGTIRFWRAADGTPERTLRGATRPPTEGSNYPTPELFAGLSFAPDGATLVAGGFGVSVWDPATGRLLHRWRERDTAVALAVCPSGRRAVYLSEDGRLRAVRVADGALLWDVQVAAPDEKLYPRHCDVDITRDGRVVLSGSEAAIEVRRLSNGALLQRIASPLGRVRRVAVRDDSRLLLAACDEGVVAWR